MPCPVMPTEVSLDKWDQRFLDLAAHIAGWSRDPSTQVGAVIAGRDKRIIALGFNGLPQGLEDRPERLTDRDTKLKLSLHAEQNALIFASGRDLSWATIYVHPFLPCIQCALNIIQHRVGRVVAPPCPPDKARWQPILDEAVALLKEAGIPVMLASDGGVIHA